ncbi:MAG TPA: histidine phosphatase family protein [Gaiellaceae bacterium]|nr:histidine phosphatase family protein [Gaiellaceae bacterium]
MATTIFLARHAETDWNRDRRWQGHADPPLNATGLEQAEELAERLAAEQLDAIYSSDLVRAVETAEAVARGRQLAVIRDSGLREIDVGEWSGLTTDEIRDRYPEAFARHEAGGDGWIEGEPHAEMHARVVGAVTRIAEANPGGRVLCVLHGGTIRALLAQAEGIDLGEWRRTRRGPANGAVATISVENGTFRLGEP